MIPKQLHMKKALKLFTVKAQAFISTGPLFS